MKNLKTINDNFSYDTDQHNWILYQWFDGTNKDNEPIRTHKTTYYATCAQMLKAVIDKSLKGCDSLVEVERLSEKLSGDLVKLEIIK